MTDHQLALLQLAIYGSPGVPQPTWRFLGEVSGIYMGITNAGDGDEADAADVIVFRGSANALDWIKDFLALAPPLPLQHLELGVIHPGFLLGMDDVYKFILKMTKGARIVIGHSLGAAHAAILCGMLAAAKTPAQRAVFWGCPRPGFQKLTAILKDSGTSITSYRNGSPDVHEHDQVTSVPLTFFPELYVPVGEFTDCYQKPKACDAWGPLAWHHMELYAEGSRASH